MIYICGAVFCICLLGDILQASDNLSRVINSYKRIIEGQVLNGEVDVTVLPSKDGELHSSNTIAKCES